MLSARRPRSRRFSRTSASLATLLLAVGLTACSNGGDGSPRWTGAFTRAISGCGGSQVSFPLDPPVEAVIESDGTFEAGRNVALFLDGCSYRGEIGQDGRLSAGEEPGCAGAEGVRRTLGIMNVFSGKTMVYLWQDFSDPSTCDVEAWGEFERD